MATDRERRGGQLGGLTAAGRYEEAAQLRRELAEEKLLAQLAALQARKQ